MKKLIIIISTFILTLQALGQNYEPQILILTPKEFNYEKVFKKDLKHKNKELALAINDSENDDYLKSEEFKKNPENIQRTFHSGIEFSKNLDFPKSSAYYAQQYLVYRFYERFPNLLILLSSEKSNGNLIELQKIAVQDKLQYVLNFSKIELFKRNKVSFAKLTVQLYDNHSQAILINSEYEGDWINPGFEFSCKPESIDCTINNALSKVLKDVIHIIATNSPTLKRERQLMQLRYDVLVSNYYSKNNNKAFLKPIISEQDSNIVLTNQFQLITDPTSTKFVAFFIEKVPSHDFKSFKDNQKDNHVNIISTKDIKDEGFLEDIPQNYAYIVKGVKYNEKWYYEKLNVTYFDAKNIEEAKQKYFFNLTKWDFFKEDSTEFNPGFWESVLFEKIKDLRQDPQWNEYGDNIWKTEEENNRPYIGLYEIVANQLKKEAPKKAKN